MARFLAAAERVAQELNCAVVIVHHCGIDASRPRGHTSLSGAVESQLKVERGNTGEVIVTLELAKRLRGRDRDRIAAPARRTRHGCRWGPNHVAGRLAGRLFAERKGNHPQAFRPPAPRACCAGRVRSDQRHTGSGKP